MRGSLWHSRKEPNQRNAIYSTFAVIFTCIFMLTVSILPAGRIEAATEPKDLDPSVETVIQSVGNRIQSTIPSPDFNSVWEVIDLYRSGLTVPTSYGDTFYKNTMTYLQDKNWTLTSTKYTEYAKLILGMTAVGKDARDISGHDLLAYLSDFSKVKLQGFNGPVWALIALKCHPEYEIPVDANVSEQTTEEGLITYILNHQTPRGGWTLVGNTPDVDITGMTIQALAPYYGKRDDVTQAVDKAVERLYLMQLETGGFSTMDVETSESCAQVIVALSSIGIDCGQDERFNCNGNWPMSRLFEYYLPEGGFMHVMAGSGTNGGGEAGALDGMATQQGMYAAIAYQRMLEGKTALYDMSDIEISPGEEVEPPKPDVTTEKQEDTTKSSSATTQTKKSNTKKKVKALYLDYKQISLQRGKTRSLKVMVSPSDASNKKVKWTSSNRKVATVTQKGKVKGIKAGNATITVTARDGSKKKASCKVIVYSLNSGNKKTTSGNTGNSSSSNWYNRQTTSGQGNSSGTSNPYYNPGSSGQTSGQTSDPGNTSTNDTSTATTEAGAWSFDGETYVADSSGDSTDVEEEFSEDEEEDSDEDESEEEDLTEDEEEEDISNLPTWLSVLLGLVSSGGIAGALRVPWLGIKDKLWVLLLSRKRR